MSLLPRTSRALGASLIAALSVATLAATAISSPAAAANKPNVIDGPDMSSNNYSVVRSGACSPATNWAKVKKAGKDFAIAKATEGTSYINPCFAQDYTGARSAGLVRGSYHFARPATPLLSSADAQAEDYARELGSVTTTKTLPPVLDFETTGGLSRPQLDTWAQDFMIKLRSLTGRTPMLYTYPAFWSSTMADTTAFARFPLWMASYGVSTAPTADVWQYTDHASISGIHGGVDESKFVGKLGRSWSTLSNGTLASPWAAAAPAAPVDVHATAGSQSAKVSWLPGDAGSSHITGYKVTAKPGGATATVGGSTFSASFSGLTTGTTYKFSVRASNAVDSGSAASSNAVIPSIPTALSAHATTSVHPGTTVPFSAKLVRRDTDKALAGSLVILYRQDGSHWTQTRRLTTDSGGRVSATLRPKQTHTYEFVYPGVRGIARSDDFVRTAVRPTVTARLSRASVARRGQVTLSGAVSPIQAGERVDRERRVSGRWKVAATRTVTKRGTYSFVIHPTKRASMVFRVAAVATHGRSAGYSPHRTLTVR
jgi:GH25 family lysozyme M1 (1,4-beta-N-acetylmuramidase)